MPHSTATPSLSPVHFFSHGSTMMLGEESDSATYWKKCGDEALANGVKHVIMMGAHWAALNETIEIASNPNPEKSPVAYVHPSKYVDYKLNPDLPMASRVQGILSNAGFDAKLNPKFDWIHDTYLILIRMFPNGSPPTTIISMNARYDPHYHMRVGSALRDLRKEPDILFVGSGGAVHNLYRNHWGNMLMHRDNFAMPVPPDACMLDFRQEFEDVFTGPMGPRLRRAATALMKLPGYREAHGTDDHFMSSLFVAGLCGDQEDEEIGERDPKSRGRLGAEDWELVNMCNSQFTLGRWAEKKAIQA